MSPLTCAFAGAGDRTRTGDPHLGKVMLYQLSHAREAAHYRGGDPFRQHRPSTLTSVLFAALRGGIATNGEQNSRDRVHRSEP
jgi:hypothetical protein